MKLGARPLLWIGGVTVAVVLLVSLLRTHQDRTEATPAARVDASAEPIATTRQPDRPSLRPESGPLPWQRSVDGATPRSGTAPTSSGPQQPQPMDRAQFMAAMQVQLQRNQVAADAALKRIAEVEASGRAPEGVDLGALRDNLEMAKQAQSLAMELARLSGEPDTPGRRQKVAAITDQLQALQGRLQQEMALRSGSQAAAAAKTR